MTTRAILVERVMKAANGGALTTNMRFSRNQVAHELNAVIAKLLKALAYDGFKDGMSTANGAIIATYPDIPIDRRDNGRSSAKLPVTPMNLPGGIGVHNVYPSGYPEKEFIPVEPGLLYAVTGNKTISPLGPQCYTYDSGRITINTDAIGAGVTTLDVKLCVSDIMSMGDNEPLPIPADIESDAVIAVLQLLGVEPTTERADNKAASPTKMDAK